MVVIPFMLWMHKPLLRDTAGHPQIPPPVRGMGSTSVRGGVRCLLIENAACLLAWIH